MITSEIWKSRVLRKITLGASAAVIMVGMVTAFSGETKASAPGDRIFDHQICTALINGEIRIVGDGNTCEVGSGSCITNHCN